MPRARQIKQANPLESSEQLKTGIVPKRKFLPTRRYADSYRPKLDKTRADPVKPLDMVIPRKGPPLKHRKPILPAINPVFLDPKLAFPIIRCVAVCKNKRMQVVREMLLSLGADIGPINRGSSGFTDIRHNYAVTNELAAAHDIDPNDITLETHPEIQCLNDALPGGPYCTVHTPNYALIKRKTKDALMELVEPCLIAALKILKHSKSDAARVAIINTVLDRTGFKAADMIKIDAGDGHHTDLSLLSEEDLKALALIHRKIKTPTIDIPAISSDERTSHDDNDDTPATPAS